VTDSDDKTRLQALSLINDCYKYIMDLTTNGVVITDAIKFVEQNRKKLIITNKKQHNKESREPEHDKDEELEETQEEEKTGREIASTRNQIF
jgi:hypothetical protein